MKKVIIGMLVGMFLLASMHIIVQEIQGLRSAKRFIACQEDRYSIDRSPEMRMNNLMVHMSCMSTWGAFDKKERFKFTWNTKIDEWYVEKKMKEMQ